MQVKRLIQLLQECDPDAFVTIGVPNCSQEYVGKLVDTPACLLHFFIEQSGDCSYTKYPHLPAMDEVAICASLDGTFFHTDEPDDEIFAGSADMIVGPDFRPEAN